MATLLQVIGTLLFMAGSVVLWGMIATGSLRAGFAYLRTWLFVVGFTITAALVIGGAFLPLLPQ